MHAPQVRCMQHSSTDFTDTSIQTRSLLREHGKYISKLANCKHSHVARHDRRICSHLSVMFHSLSDTGQESPFQSRVEIQRRRNCIYFERWTLRRTLGCENFLPGPAWLLLSKTCPPFSPSLYNCKSITILL